MAIIEGLITAVIGETAKAAIVLLQRTPLDQAINKAIEEWKRADSGDPQLDVSGIFYGTLRPDDLDGCEARRRLADVLAKYQIP